MNGSKTWEEESLARLQHAREQLTSAEAQRQQADQAIDRWKNYIQALETILELDQQSRGIPINGSGHVDPASLRAMSVHAALQEIARRQHGLISAVEAIEVLVAAGVYKSKEQARGNVYSTLHRSRYFRKERPGVYHLMDAKEKPLSTAL